MISIVMSYYNRRQHLINTLNSILQSRYTNYEVVVVDDGSSDEHRIEYLQDTYKFLKVIRIEPSEKNHTNPCIPTNIAIQNCIGDIIIIQNPECFHCDDILTYTADNIKENVYLAYTTVNKNVVDKLMFIDWNIDYKQQLKYLVGDIDINKSLPQNHWYCHERFRPKAYNFCTAILREDLKKLNGFDERYAYGVDYDDDEFLHRIIKMGMSVKFIGECLVIHQHHSSHYEIISDKNLVNSIRKRNYEIYKNYTCKETEVFVNPDKIIVK